jgi:hypothetical protein
MVPAPREIAPAVLVLPPASNSGGSGQCQAADTHPLPPTESADRRVGVRTDLYVEVAQDASDVRR